MHIASISPRNGSVYGGTTLTLTGTGFGRFGLHNEIVLSFANATTGAAGDGKLEGPADRYDDDYLWGRGNRLDNGTVTGTWDLDIGAGAGAMTEVLCVPKTFKNRECRYTDTDSGYECTESMAWGYDPLVTRLHAEWFDYSTPTYIECVVETLREALPSGAVATVNVSIVNSSLMLNEVGW